MIVYTDGLFEVDDPTGQQFGQERLLETIRAGVTLPLSKLFCSLRKAVGAWGCGRFDDDACLLRFELARIISPSGVSVHKEGGI